MGDPAATARFDGTMLKFLTHKLRTHSLNEDPNQEKVDDDHDSGTESDDEFQNGGDIADEFSTTMDSLEEAAAARDSAVPSDADLGASPPSTTTTHSSAFGFQHQQLAASSSSGCSSTETPPIEQSYEFLLRLAQSDQHSSEEELEVINGPKVVETAATAAPSVQQQTAAATQTPLPLRPNAAPEKRKWSEANSGSCVRLLQQQNADGDHLSGTAFSAPVSRTGREAGSGSSDEEVQGLCYSRSGSAISQPVQFRSSPPTDAHKPVRSLSPPPKLFHASVYSSSCSLISPSTSSSEQQQQRSHHHRPRSRPRPHSQYPSHTSLDSHHHHHHHHHHHQHQQHSHGQSQQQELRDLDVIGACSPRKRHRPPHRLPRPCLDFEKMQQMKTQAVTTWRHTSEHGKELSVFCW